MLDTNIDENICPMVAIIGTGPRYTVEEIIAAFPLPDENTPKHAPFDPPTVESSLTNADRIQIAEECIEHCKKACASLWTGNYESSHSQYHSGKEFASNSEADFRLCRLIARYCAPRLYSAVDLEKLVERIFEQSVLAQREKWMVREDYRRRTIAKACEGVTLAKIIHNGPQPNIAATPDPTLQGDLYTARFFSDRYRDRLIYVREFSEWMYWNGARWKWCKNGEELRAAKDTAVAISQNTLSTIGEDGHNDSATAQLKKAASTHHLRAITAMIELAKSEEGMSINADKLDQHRHLLGVANGVVNLKKCLLIENQPHYYITKFSNVEYHEDASDFSFKTFLRDVLQDPETVDATQVLAGQSLTGELGEEHIVLCVGIGANGKSIFGNVISRVMGDYAVTAPSSLLEARRAGDHSARSDIAMLAGTRLVSVNELPGGMQLDEVIVKQLAGREKISARQLYKDFITFDPTFTVWVRTNHKPIVRGTDNGIWRRLIILHFGRTFSEEEQDPNLEEKLMRDKGGVLAWMVKGASRYYKDGIVLSPSMKRHMASYRQESDLFAEFLEDEADRGPEYEVEQRVLYSDYRFWCERSGLNTLSKKAFTEKLIERGFGQRKSDKKRFYTGIKGRRPFWP